MVSLKLNATAGESWDLVIDNGVVLTRDSEYTAQKVRQLLQTIRGEYFRNTTHGIAWITELLGARGTDGVILIKSEIRNAIEKNAVLLSLGVQSVIFNSIDFSQQTRKLSIDMTIKTNDGEQNTEEFTL